MIKRNFTFILPIFLSLIICVVATRDYVPRNINIDRSNVPKNILVGSFVGGRSHLKPMLDVTAILSERGYNIILLTAGNYTPASEYPTVKQISLGKPIRVRDLNLLDPQKKFDLTSMTMLLEFGLKSYKNTFEKYKNVAENNNIDLFFCDILVNDACLDAAQALKKPAVGFTPFLSGLSPATYKSDPMFDCAVSLENESFLERFRCTIVQPIRWISTMRSIGNQLNDVRKEINIDPAPASQERLLKTALTLVDGFFGFELPQALPPNVQEIGPVLSDEYPKLTSELSSFINKHKRVLYVSFGTRVSSTVKNNDKLLRSFVEIINKNIVDGIVWALVNTPKDNFSPTLSLDDGSQIQTLPILNNEHPHIHIAEFAPQFAILNHTNTKLFLSHGGAGSSHESLYTGTPMLVLPFIGDQMGNAEKLKLAGIALTLDKNNLEVNDIVNKIDFLLKDENVKKNTKRLEVLTKLNSKRKHRAADLIEYLLHSSRFNDEFAKEWIPANTRMGPIRGNNYDVYVTLLGISLGFIGGFLWITLNLIRFIVKELTRSAGLKSKRE